MCTELHCKNGLNEFQENKENTRPSFLFGVKFYFYLFQVYSPSPEEMLSQGGDPSLQYSSPKGGIPSGDSYYIGELLPWFLVLFLGSRGRSAQSYELRSTKKTSDQTEL